MLTAVRAVRRSTAIFRCAEARWRRDRRRADATIVRGRLTAAVSDERIEQHMVAGRLRVDGELVTDLDAPAPAVRRVMVWAD